VRSALIPMENIGTVEQRYNQWLSPLFAIV
jgi:hypothetical protein